jgi:hypothetical protein
LKQSNALVFSVFCLDFPTFISLLRIFSTKHKVSQQSLILKEEMLNSLWYSGKSFPQLPQSRSVIGFECFMVFKNYLYELYN